MKAEDQALAAYEAILEGIGARAEQMGPRPLVSHWPHQGSAHRSGGLFFAGQALDGWDASVSSARWWPADARTSEGRKRILAGTRSWHAELEEPIQGVLEFSNRRRSSFWTLARDLVRALVPHDPNHWFSQFVWGNVYPIGYDKHVGLGMRAGGPVGALKEVQNPHVGELLGALVRMVNARRIVIVAGPDYWREAERSLDLGLAPAPFPLIGIGRSSGRSWVVGYHPTYARKAGGRLHGPGAGSNAYYVAAVQRGFEELGSLPDPRGRNGRDQD